MSTVVEEEGDLFTILMKVAKDSLPELKKAYPSLSEKELINMAMREGLAAHMELVEEELEA